MREMISSVGTSPQRLVKTVNDAVRTQQRQQMNLAAPEVGMVGVPGEPDYKKGVTEAFGQMMPFHKNTGNGITGGIAYRTDPLAWRDYNPGFYDGLFAPEGEYDSKPYYYTDLAVAALDPSQIKTGDPDAVVYGETATPTRSQARPTSTSVIQDTDKY